MGLIKKGKDHRTIRVNTDKQDVETTTNSENKHKQRTHDPHGAAVR